MLIILSPAYHGNLRVFFLINRLHGLNCFFLVILVIRGDPTPRRVICEISVITLIILSPAYHGNLRVFFLINRFHGLNCFFTRDTCDTWRLNTPQRICVISVITLIVFLSTDYTDSTVSLCGPQGLSVKSV